MRSLTGSLAGAVALLVGFGASSPVVAGPRIEAGDVTLRHDLQWFADTGVLTGPSLSWPVAWSRVAVQLQAVDETKMPTGQLAALNRLRKRAAGETRSDGWGVQVGLAAAESPQQIRTFEDTPREDAEASVVADWLGERFAVKLAATVVDDPEDGQQWRADGSYAAVSLGNWIVSVGEVNRWWGPGWDGSLILSTNARPVPAIAIERNDPKPFETPLLRWLGPWRFTTFMGQLESDRDYAHARLSGARFEVRPLPSLQLAASRTAQWCGEGRPCGLDTFWDLLSGNDNDQGPAQQPGNQLAGFDVRWSWPGGRVPVAAYAQAIGEDEAGFMPAKYLGLMGLEAWGALAGGSWRAHLEYADTACDFINSQPDFGCAYRHSIYTSGYRYRGRPIGHAIDGDGETLGASLTFVDSGDRRWQLDAREARLNREGLSLENSLAAGPTRWHDLGLTYESTSPWGNIVVSAGYVQVEGDADTSLEDGWRAHVAWRQRLR